MTEPFAGRGEAPPPLVRAPHDVQESAPGQRGGGSSRTILIVTLLAVVAAAGGAAAYLFLIQPLGEPEAESAPVRIEQVRTTESQPGTDSTSVEDEGEPQSAGPSTTSTVATTAATETRFGTLFAGVARIRSEADLEAPIVVEINGAEGAVIEVIGPNKIGWYLVSYQGTTGWIFGAFVVPPDPGLSVAITANRQPAVLVDASGGVLGIENKSGNRLLITEVGSPLHAVLLPDGNTAFVRAADAEIVSP